jgi:hypothetical protein
MMSLDVQIIPLSDPDRWRAELAVDGRPSQAWDYLSAISRPGAEPRLAVVRAQSARMVLPFIERAWQGTVDIVTPLGLSGASMQPASTAPVDLWRDYAVSRGWVAGYIQLADDLEIEPRCELDKVVAGNEIFLLDLTGSDAMASASEIVRRKLRRAVKLGATLVRDPVSLADALVRLYPDTMARLGASSVYLHDEAGLRQLAKLEGAVVVGAAIDGEVESVSVFLRAGGRAEYLCNACSLPGRDLAAWLISEAAKILQAQGATELNLGGGVATGDGLHQFKARFNARPRRLRSLRQVYDKARYLELCAARGTGSDGGWFPAYRAPVSPQA